MVRSTRTVASDAGEGAGARQPNGVEFAPLSLQPRRARRADPLAVLIAVVIGLVGLAVAKPWQSSEPGAAERAVTPSVAPPAAEATARPISATVPLDRIGSDPAAMAGLGFVLAATRSHDGWGVRVVVDAPASRVDLFWPGLKEEWSPVRPDGPAATLQVGSSAVRAFGLTVPAGTAPLDVRAWRVDGPSTAQWLQTIPLDGRPAGAGPLLWPPRDGSSWARAWAPGHYRFEVLTASGVISVDAVIAGSTIPDDLRGPSPSASPFGSPATPAPRAPDVWSARGPFALDTNGLDAGAFVITQGTAFGNVAETGTMAPAIAVSGGPPTTVFDERAAWLDALPTSIEQGGHGSTLASSWLTTYQPAAVALGVIAPDGAQIDGARILRLEPAGIRTQRLSRSFVDVHPAFRDEQPRRSIVQFPSPDAATWSPGVYGLIVDLDVAGVVRHVLYGVTLLPGPESHPPALVAAARAWAPHGGAWAIVTGLADTVGWGPTEALAPAAAGVRSVAATPIPPNGGPIAVGDPAQTCGSGATIDAADPIIGVAHPTGLLPVNAGLSRIFDGGSVPMSRPVLAGAVTPGLSLVAPGEGQSWELGIYRLTLVSEDDISSFVVCVGQAQDGVLTVPADSASAAAYATFRRRLSGE